MNEPRQHPKARGKAHERLVRLMLAGKLTELGAALRATPASELPAVEREELRASLEFNLGAIRVPPVPSSFARMAWRVWIDVPGGRHVVLGLLRLVALCVSLLGMRARVFERLRLALAPDVVHFRYTDFLQGLVHSAVLLAFAPPSEVVQRGYYRGLVGMMECVSGRFDLGLASLDAGHAILHAANERENSVALVDADTYERFQSVATVRALYLSYAGDHERAYREYARILDRTQTIGRYVLIEIFTYWVRMSSDLEMLDAESLSDGVAALKRLLGTQFRGKFALRAAICTSLVATIQGKSELARQQLALGDELSSDNSSAVELSRYHFLRALVHLESLESSVAMIHARRASAITARVRGARFHEADMILLELELRLRGPLREGKLAPRADERADIQRRFRKVRRLVRGSPLMEGRLRALRLYDSFLRGDFKRTERDYPAVTALAQRVSRRVEHGLKEIDTRKNEMQALALTEPDARRARDLSLLDRFGRLVRSDARDDEAAALLTSLVGAESCEVRSEHGVRGERAPIEIRPHGDVIEVVVTAATDRSTFTLHRPLIELRFDVRAAELVRLAAEIICVAMGRRQLVELQRHVAIARTTQMLAHDVRRPFGTLQAVMKAIAASRSPEAVRATCDALLPEVQKASAAVTALIDDVVELGDERAPRRERAVPELLIGECITEALRMPEVDAIEVDYSLDHRRPWSVDAKRVPRLLSNLCANGVQALRGRGKIWVRSRDVGDQVEMAIGNDGPPIPAEDMPHVFQAFFTKGKPGGTGLGLAIAHHVVTAHGGRIECRAPREGKGVEFVFTLPAATGETLDARAAGELRASLPRDSRACALVSIEDSVPALRAKLSAEERAAIARLGYRARPLDVLLVDDERASVATVETCLGEVAPPGTLRVSSVGSAGAASTLARERPPDLVVVDAHLGASHGGLQVVRALRRAGVSAYICVHADAASAEDMRAAVAAGADIVLLKPLSIAHALRLLAAAAERVTPPSRAVQSEPDRPLVALVDDSRAHFADWRGALQEEATLRFYASPADFWTATESEPALLADLDVVITDYVFLESREDGVSFARALKRRRSDLPVCLSTSGYAEDDLGGAIDLVLSKSAISWTALAERLRAQGYDGGDSDGTQA